MERIRKNSRKPQVKLSEIVLLPGPNRPMNKTIGLAQEIIKAVNRGASFSAIAKQYSASGTARNGGALGWAAIDQLPIDIKRHVEKLDIGAVSTPLERDGLVFLFNKEGTRNNGLADPSQDIVTFARAIYPLDPTASNADKLEAAARVERDTANLKTCDGIVELHKKYKSGFESLIENVSISSFNTPVRKMISGLSLSVPSKPLSFIEGVSVFMLCNRASSKISAPSREDVSRAEFDKIFGSLSERYMSRLRRTATIETDL